MFSLQARAPMQLSWRRRGLDGHHHRRLEFSQFSIEDLKRPDVHHPVGNNFTLPSPYQGARMTGSNYIIIDSRWLGSCDPMFFQNQKNGVPWEQLSCKALASAFPRKRSLERPQDSIYLAFLDLTSAFTAFLGAGVRGISSFSASFSILRSLAFRWLRNGLRSWMMTMIVHCHMDLTCAILIVQLVVTIYGQQNHM